MWKYYLKRESCCSGATALNYKYELIKILSSYLPFHWNLFFVFFFCWFFFVFFFFVCLFFAKVEFTIHGRLTTELGQLFHPFLKPCPLQWDFALPLMRKWFLFFYLWNLDWPLLSLSNRIQWKGCCSTCKCQPHKGLNTFALLFHGSPFIIRTHLSQITGR